MVNVRKRRCSNASCTKYPKFNFEGSKTGVYCSLHAEDGMVDVNSKRCWIDSCTKQPSFNFKGSNTGAYCKKHAAEGMVNLRLRRDSYASCNREPSLDAEGSEATAYCKQYADDNGLANTDDKRCTHDPCLKRPWRDILNNGEAIASLRRKSDHFGGPVVNFSVKCDVEDCQNVSRCGLDRIQPTPCRDHASSKGGLVWAVGRASFKKRGRNSSDEAVKDPSFEVKSECVF